MTSQKLENLLNLALNSAEDEREKSLNLNVGYDPLDREWDLIIKYSVNLDRVRKIASKVTELQNEYAVIRITESRIDILSGIPEVEYVEKPKRLFFQAAEDGIVSVVASVGNKNPVPRFNTLSLGSHISYCPVTIFPALRTILHIPSVR